LIVTLTILTGVTGLSLASVWVASIFFTTSMPAVTLPNTALNGAQVRTRHPVTPRKQHPRSIHTLRRYLNCMQRRGSECCAARARTRVSRVGAFVEPVQEGVVHGVHKELGAAAVGASVGHRERARLVGDLGAAQQPRHKRVSKLVKRACSTEGEGERGASCLRRQAARAGCKLTCAHPGWSPRRCGSWCPCQRPGRTRRGQPHRERDCPGQPARAGQRAIGEEAGAHLVLGAGGWAAGARAAACHT